MKKSIDMETTGNINDIKKPHALFQDISIYHAGGK
jgi:hypothetical protein